MDDKFLEKLYKHQAQEFDMPVEEIKKFHEDWDKIVESHHDLETEKSIDIKICYELDEYGFQKFNDKDFEIYYKYNSNELIQKFSHRKTLKYLFQNGFNFVILNEQNKIFKKLVCIDTHNLEGKNYPVRHRVTRSPEINIVKGEQSSLAIFIEGKNLYCYSGCCHSSDGIYIDYFQYLGELI